MRRILLTTVLTFALALGAIGKDVIAVLPYNISYDGRIPDRLTKDQMDLTKSQESKFYQASMINYLSKYNNRRRFRKANASVLSQGQVTALLIEKGLTEADLHKFTNTKLAELLGVNHVVRGTATRTFIMSEELAAGIQVVSVLTGNVGAFPTATSSINVINSLENLKDNNVIYSRQYRRNTSVTRSDEQSIKHEQAFSARRMMRALKRANK